MSRKFITKHENGQIRSITTTLNGVLEGEIKYWHKNGHIGEEGYLQNGNANGEFKSWYECGRIHERKFYKNGKLDGERQEWFSTGIRWYRAFYRNGAQVYLNYGDAKNPLSKLKSVLHARILHNRSIILHDFLISDLADSLFVYRNSTCQV